MRRFTAILMGCVGLHLASSGPLAGQTRPGATVGTSAVSEFQASWEAPDRLVTRSVSRRFSPIQISGLGDISAYFLLAETFDVHQVTPGEGVRGVVSASLSPLRPEGIGDPVWSLEAPGSQADLAWYVEGLYRVTDVGCCSGEGTHTYFSMLTGRELFRGNGPLVRIRTPLGRRFVAFHNSNASIRSVERASDSTVVGVLYYGDDRSPASRLILTHTRKVWSGSVALLVNGAKTLEHAIWSGTVGRPAVNADPSVIGGFSILVELTPLDSSEPEPFRIEIPIVSDSLALDQARFPSGVRIRNGVRAEGEGARRLGAAREQVGGGGLRGRLRHGGAGGSANRGAGR